LPGQEVVFGFGAHSGIDEVPDLLRMAQQADRDGLDIFSLSDHPYLGADIVTDGPPAAEEDDRPMTRTLVHTMARADVNAAASRFGRRGRRR
jgi:hypothetical protein